LLNSADIGLTPLLVMHRLADERSAREVWWIHTTSDADTMRSPVRSPALLAQLTWAHSLVYYTTPAQPLAHDSGVRTGRLSRR